MNILFINIKKVTTIVHVTWQVAIYQYNAEISSRTGV
jgi:hypothetical protein